MANKTGKGGPPKALTDKDVGRVMDILEAKGGIKTETATELGVNRSTLYAFLADHPEIEAHLAEVREGVKDIAEGNVLKAIKDGDLKLSRWYLERQAGERGYGNKLGVSGPKGGAIPIEGTVTTDWSKVPTEALEAIVAARVTDATESD